jgi:hypothetical protein
MSPTQSSHFASPPLAGAFLALADHGDVLEHRRSLATILAAAAAAWVIALSAPLAWVSTPAPKPSDQPSATAASKAAVPAPDDDGGDGA